MPEITDRYVQHALHRPRYFTGRPCKRGHIAERYVSTGACVACLNLTHRPLVANNLLQAPRQFLFPSNFDATAVDHTFAILESWTAGKDKGTGPAAAWYYLRRV